MLLMMGKLGKKIFDLLFVFNHDSDGDGNIFTGSARCFSNPAFINHADVSAENFDNQWTQAVTTWAHHLDGHFTGKIPDVFAVHKKDDSSMSKL